MHVATVFDIIRDHLCDTYKKTRFTPKGAEWPPIQPRLIVSLTLIHYKRNRTQQELLKMATIHKEGAPAIDQFTFQEPSSKKPRLDYSWVTKSLTDIFAADPADLIETSTRSIKTPKRILIEGAPGIGKTVLAKEIASSWASNEILIEIKVVFLLYLRDPHIQSIITTKQLIEYMSMGCLDDEQITTLNKHLVNTKGQQLCIVMDGFDECPTENSFIVDIINGVFLHEAIVVITSRPTATVSLHDRVDRRIEILGLPKEERENYISQIFSNSLEKKDKLEKYLNQHPVINGLCFVPFHLAVLLYLFQQDSLPETLTEMNECFILHTIYRHLMKHGLTPSGPINELANVPKPVLDIVYKLSELAFKGLQENKLVFTFDEIKQRCSHIDETVGAINGFGLLQAVEHYPHKGVGTTKSFNFLHYTMQEFLAAFHVSTLPSEQQSSLMKKTFWDGHYNFMWMMFVGIVGIKSDVFVSFVSKGKVYKQKSGIRMAENILSDKRKRLHVFQCYMEAKSTTEAPDVISDMFKDGKVIINEVKLFPHHISSLMTFMSNLSMKWKILELSKCNITGIGMSVLKQFISDRISTLQYVNLSHNDSSPWGVYCTIIRYCSVYNLALCGGYGMEEHVNEMTEGLKMNTSLQSLTFCNMFEKIKLIKTVVSCITTLNEVNLPCRVVTAGDFHEVKDLLFHTTLQYKCDDTTLVSDSNRTMKVNLLCNKSCDSISTGNLKSLDASQQGIDDYGVTVITTFCDGFEIIDLSSNRISDDGVITVSDYSKNNIYLLELNLSKNKITSEGAKQIAEAIKINTVLQNINISNNYISTEGLLYFMEAVKNNYSLQVVKITHNNVTRSGFTSIKQCIENFQCPIQIYASWNEINKNGELVTKISTSCAPDNIDTCMVSSLQTDHSVFSLSECLKEDDTLQELDLSNRGITREGAKLIGKAIKVNKTLKELDISGNPLFDDGATAISDGLKSNNSLQELNMGSGKISNKGVKRIAEAIEVNTNLKILNINRNTISDDGVVAISDSLRSNNSLQELNLEYNKITSEGAKKVAEAIKVNTTLKIININRNTISDDGVVAISDSLRSNNSLQELNMSSNQISSEGAKKIAEAIKVNTTLKIININRNTISDDGVVAISDSLRSNNSLQELNMSSNQISSEGAKKIAEAIKVNTTLKIININRNTISDDGVVAISDSLKSNNSLQELNMSSNQISSEGAKKIAEAIKVNITLHTLYLYQSDINDALSFNMTVLTAVYHNNTIMKLKLPWVYGDDDKRLVSSEVEKINKERTGQGISTLTCEYNESTRLY